MESFTAGKNVPKIVCISLIFVDTDIKVIFENSFCGKNAEGSCFQSLDTINESHLFINEHPVESNFLPNKF